MKSEVIALVLLTGAVCVAQQLDLSSLDKLSEKARESRVITLDPDKLGLASEYLPGDKPEEQQLKGLVKGLKGVYVRSFEFDEKGMYSRSDVDGIRKQLGGPGWSKFIEVKDSEEHVEMWFYKSGDTGGLAIVAAEPKELTVVHISGPADLTGLTKLADLMKISGVSLSKRSGSDSSKKEKEEEDDDEN